MAHEDSLFCPYPWISLCAETNGILAPCDISTNYFDNITPYPTPEVYKNEIQNSPFLRKLRLDLLNGIKNSNCEKCWKSEESGMTSLRQHTGNFFKHDKDWATQNTASDGSFNGVIEFFDIRPGHKCNLKCRMCTIVQSSAWLSDHEFLTGQKFDGKKQNLLWGEDPGAWQNIFANIETSLARVDKIHIMFVGGEPLIEKNHLIFLRRCVSEGLAGRIDLRYTSNITVLPEEVLKLWESFRTLYLASSIDAVGAMNDYIRYPSSWKNIEQNLLCLADLDHVYTWVQPCASIYNIFQMPELYEWGAGRMQYHNGKKVPLEIHSHILHEPDFLNISILPEKVVASLKVKFDKFSHLAGSAFLFGALDFAKSKPPVTSLDAFWDFTLKLDQRRRQNFADVAPEWNRILRSF